MQNSLYLNHKDFVSNCSYEFKNFTIYKVVPTVPAATETTSQQFLLHGTKAQNVMGILEHGFKPSISGRHGPGLYLTDNYRKALEYAGCCEREGDLVKKLKYLFVNRVKRIEPSNLEKVMKFEEYTKAEPTLQEFKIQKPVTLVKNFKNINLPTLNHDLGDNSKNEKGCQLNKNGSKCNEVENSQFYDKGGKIVLAHHGLVIPAYLIEFEENIGLDWLINYNLIDFKYNNWSSESFRNKKRKVEKMLIFLSKQNNPFIPEGYTLEMIKERLKK